MSGGGATARPPLNITTSQPPKLGGQEGITVIPVTKMTESGKAIDPRARALDGKSLAPRTQPGQTCLGYTAVLYPGKDSNYPAGLIACPSRIEGKHWCVLNKLTTEDLRFAERRADYFKAAWDIGDRTEDLWELREETYDKINELKARIAVEAAKHEAIYAKYERELLHATNSANARAKLGPWEFTLTYSPTSHGWSADEAKDSMRTAIERLTRYYREELEEFHAVGEYTAAGAPHVHAWYKLEGGRKMTSKSFKRAYPIWNERHKLGRGHEGGHHEPVKRTSDFAGYVEKHLDTAWLQVDITNAPETPSHEDDATPPDYPPDDSPSDSTDDAGERT